jgi:2-keto-4-pentenoate hydratase/2-oxohepta-3-ene-1,7-dioic acid hydratase in catechol pathway
MQLVTINDIPTGSVGARLQSGEILHLARAARYGTIEMLLPSSLIALLEAGEEAMDIVRRIVDAAESGQTRAALNAKGALLPPHTPLLAPIPRPGMIVAAGLNFRSHLAEMNGTAAPPHPTAFMKAPSSIASPGAELALPPQASEAVDYEGELACIFGRTCHMVSPEDALRHIAGYSVANDLSARDWAPAVHASKVPWEARLTWEVNIMGKQLPGFTPLGPTMITADAVGDPHDFRLMTRLNGQVMQDAPISDMLFPLAEAIAYFSRWYTFQPGDIFLSGTPAGVGAGRKPPVYLRPGDRLEVEIAEIGVLSTPVRAA